MRKIAATSLVIMLAMSLTAGIADAAFRGGFRGGFRGFGGPRFGVVIGAPLYLPFGPYYPYNYPYPYAYPPVYAPPPAPAYGYPGYPTFEDEGRQQEQDWYYCEDPRGYYPDVRTCNRAWQPVPATPPPGY
jgi:hypothetical protein